MSARSNALHSVGTQISIRSKRTVFDVCSLNQTESYVYPSPVPYNQASSRFLYVSGTKDKDKNTASLISRFLRN